MRNVEVMTLTIVFLKDKHFAHTGTRLLQL